MNYPSRAAEPVSIMFAENGSLTWIELAGETIGTWKLESGQLIISLGASVSFKANVVNNQFTNIKSTDLMARTLNSGSLNETLDVILDNTKWTAPNLILGFKPGGKVDLSLGGGGITYPNVSYVRKGKSIRFTPAPSYNWFLVTSSLQNMKGANMAPSDPTLYAFVAARQ
jgi:hypothetical protein